MTYIFVTSVDIVLAVSLIPVFPSNALSTPIWPSSAFASSSGYSAGS